MRKQFFVFFTVLFTLCITVCFFYPQILWINILLGPLFLTGLHNVLQKRKAILRNFPLLGVLRYAFEKIRPEIQQYFVESETNGTPFPREQRSLVYQRAKMETDTLPFGTQRNVYEEGYEWLNHSIVPKKVNAESLRVKIGGPRCAKPYNASILNISAMSYGSLSKNAVLALNGGAKLGGFYHNTGEGGVSPYHLAGGGDLVWQIGTGYFGCRDENGSFCPATFAETATLDQIKMIEIKLSQGAKPGHGGILPAAKVTEEIVAIRKVKMGKDVISPPSHSAFNTPVGLLNFITLLREKSGGKPIGFKLCVGKRSEFISICKAMVSEQVYPDFITVDGGEGGTGAAPLEFSNSVGAPLEEGLSFVVDALRGFDLKKHIKVIASGKIANGFHLFSRIALGADLCNSARAMMLSLGCIQARVCNTNRCPTGVATSDPSLVYGLDPEDKKVRVYHFQQGTVKAFSELVGAVGLIDTTGIRREHVMRRTALQGARSYAELFPEIRQGTFLKGNAPDAFLEDLEFSDKDSFDPVKTLPEAA